MLSDYINSTDDRDRFYSNMDDLEDHSYLLKKVLDGETTFRKICEPFVRKSIEVETDFYNSRRIITSKKEIIGRDDREDLGYLAQQLYEEDLIDVQRYFHTRIKIGKRESGKRRSLKKSQGSDALAGFMAGIAGMAFIPFGGGSLVGAVGVGAVSATVGIGGLRTVNLVQNSLCTSFESDRNYFISALDSLDILVHRKEEYRNGMQRMLTVLIYALAKNSNEAIPQRD